MELNPNFGIIKTQLESYVRSMNNTIITPAVQTDKGSTIMYFLMTMTDESGFLLATRTATNMFFTTSFHASSGIARAIWLYKSIDTSNQNLLIARNQSETLKFIKYRLEEANELRDLPIQEIFCRALRWYDEALPRKIELDPLAFVNFSVNFSKRVQEVELCREYAKLLINS